MIVREFLDDPSLPFDYFNDYKDTMDWLKWYAQHPEGWSEHVPRRVKTAIRTLEKGYEGFVAGLGH